MIHSRKGLRNFHMPKVRYPNAGMDVARGMLPVHSVSELERHYHNWQTIGIRVLSAFVR